MSGGELAEIVEIGLRLGVEVFAAHRRGELADLTKKRVGEILPTELRTTIAKREAEAKAKAKLR